jgi:hypothetical protein
MNEDTNVLLENEVRRGREDEGPGPYILQASASEGQYSPDACVIPR